MKTHTFRKPLFPQLILLGSAITGLALANARAQVTVEIGSKVYGVPIGSNSLALYYNKKMFADAGVTSPPTTWPELTEAAAKTTKPPVYGIAFSAVNTEEATWQWEP